MVGVVNGFRSSILGEYIKLPIQSMILSAVISILILVSGLFYFRRMEKQFADVI